MRALYVARVRRAVCPACAAPAQHDGHIYCHGCRVDRAQANRNRRYLTRFSLSVTIAHTTSASLSSCVALRSSSAVGPPI